MKFLLRYKIQKRNEIVISLSALRIVAKKRRIIDFRYEQDQGEHGQKTGYKTCDKHHFFYPQKNAGGDWSPGEFPS
jgi:hypothetical protein